MSIQSLRAYFAPLALLALLPAAGLVAAPLESTAPPEPVRQGEQENDADAVATEVDAASGALRATAAEDAEIGPDGKRMTITETDRPPIIDGIVDEDIWARAEVVSDFLTREPVEAGQPSGRTEVRMLFDADNIYIGFVMHDDDPAGIMATDLQRDSRLATDDTIAVIFDTFHDHRNGFLFRVNPLGTKYDATVRDERDMNSQWDERWEAAARITPTGWEAEMMIPFKALRYSTSATVWGIDFKREVRRSNEEANWANYRRGFDFRNVSQSGHLLGLRDLKLTGRYKLKPFLSGGYTSLNATSSPERIGDGDVGIEDFKVQLTSNLTADITVNTDFAQVEDDQERVNLTRFPLFFSERREFFLEGSDNFQFGGSGGGFGGPSTLLYHSRNIGLFAGRQTPMRYGAKITGKIGSTSVGFINAQTGAVDDIGYDGRNYTAVRLKQDILSRSSVGMIFTNVQGGGDHNRVGGIDANFRFFDHLRVDGYVAQSTDSRVEGGSWVGSFGTSWFSDLWSASARVNYVDAEFEPELGFVRRNDQINQDYSLGWSPRPDLDWLRQVRLFARLDYTTDVAGQLQTREQGLSSRFQLESGDSFNVNYERTFERLLSGFSPSDQAEVLAGDYSWDEWRFSIDTYRGRRIQGRLNYTTGGFFGGTRRAIGTSMSIRFNEKLSLGPRYDFNRVTLPGDAFSTHVAGVRATYNFSDRWLTNALVQYNSVADTVAIFARLNYIHRTGDDFFLVYKSTIRYDLEFYGQMDQALVAKYTRSFDF